VYLPEIRRTGGNHKHFRNYPFHPGPEATLMSRLHEHLFGLSVLGPAACTEDLAGCTNVQLQPKATQAFEPLLRNSGQWRGGLLVGRVVDKTLELHFASQNGFARCDALPPPLAFDVRYVLGWFDALTVVCDLPVDWVGSWVMRADRRQVDLAEALSLMRGHTGGLFDDSRVLLCVAQDNGRLSATAYRWAWSADIERLEVIQLP
jgi:hypothetical protein